MMTTIQQQINEISKQQNTLNLINQMLDKTRTETLRIETDNTFNYDQDRINDINEFLTIQKNEVQAEITDLLDDCVSGC